MVWYKSLGFFVDVMPESDIPLYLNLDSFSASRKIQWHGELPHFSTLEDALEEAICFTDLHRVADNIFYLRLEQ